MLLIFNFLCDIVGALGTDTSTGLFPVMEESAIALANGLGLNALSEGRLSGFPRNDVGICSEGVSPTESPAKSSAKLLVSCSATSVVIVASTPELRNFDSNIDNEGDEALSAMSQSEASLPGADDSTTGRSLVAPSCI